MARREGPTVIPWAFAVLLAAIGIFLDTVHRPYAATGAFAAGVWVLLVLAARRARMPALSIRGAVFVPSSLLLIGALFLFQYGPGRGAPHAAALLASALQLVLFALAIPAERRRFHGGRLVVALFGHSIALLGTYSLLVSPGRYTDATGLAYAGSLVLLTLTAYWTHREAKAPDEETLRSWEAPYLLAALATLVALAFARLPTGTDTFLFLLEGLKAGMLASLALLAGPPPLPRALRAKPGGVVEFVTQALALIALLNLLLLLVIRRWPLLSLPLFVLLTAWLLAAVAGEAVALVHGARRRPAYDEATPRMIGRPFTVVVAAMNEAATIERTVLSSLGLPDVVRVIVVVSRRSTDGTQSRSRALAREHTGRVLFVEGTGGSKAEDLTNAWTFVDTEYALIVDADEVVEEETLGWAWKVLRTETGVGIVQGRKVRRPSDHPLLDIMIDIERRFSTLFDHVVQADLFDAAHFAGSAALLRSEVPRAVGGWSPATLTEDIEFTMRLYQQTPWRIRYEPRFRVREDQPAGFGSFLRQRGRWARGWGQVAGLHFGNVVRGRVRGKRAFGLGWQLATAVSAPWSAFFPALAVLWLWGEGLPFPAALNWVLAFLILPSRLVTYTYPYFHDPARPERPRAVRSLLVAAAAYAWIPLGWMLQLQALYLELSAGPRVWRSTRTHRLAVR